MIRGKINPLSKLEREFWNRFPALTSDDPEDNLNEIIGIMRAAAVKYFESVITSS